MAKEKEVERINPVLIKDPETGEEKYKLEFSRKTIKNAERNGFKLNDVLDYPMGKTVELFYWSLQMHHKGMTMDKAEVLFDEIGGMAQEGLIKRLFELYNEPFRALQGDEDTEKNGKKYVVDM